MAMVRLYCVGGGWIDWNTGVGFECAGTGKERETDQDVEKGSFG